MNPSKRNHWRYAIRNDMGHVIARGYQLEAVRRRALQNSHLHQVLYHVTDEHARGPWRRRTVFSTTQVFTDAGTRPGLRDPLAAIVLSRNRLSNA